MSQSAAGFAQPTPRTYIEHRDFPPELRILEPEPPPAHGTSTPSDVHRAALDCLSFDVMTDILDRPAPEATHVPAASSSPEVSTVAALLGMVPKLKVVYILGWLGLSMGRGSVVSDVLLPRDEERFSAEAYRIISSSVSAPCSPAAACPTCRAIGAGADVVRGTAVGARAQMRFGSVVVERRG